MNNGLQKILLRTSLFDRILIFGVVGKKDRYDNFKVKVSHAFVLERPAFTRNNWFLETLFNWKKGDYQWHTIDFIKKEITLMKSDTCDIIDVDESELKKLLSNQNKIESDKNFVKWVVM